MKTFLWILVVVLLWEPICIALIAFLLVFGSAVASCQQGINGLFHSGKAPAIIQQGGRS